MNKKTQYLAAGGIMTSILFGVALHFRENSADAGNARSDKQHKEQMTTNVGNDKKITETQRQGKDFQDPQATNAASSDQVSVHPEAPPAPDNEETTKLLDIARGECKRLNAPIQNRTATTILSEAVATVTFHAPTGTLAGDFVLIIDRQTGEIVDAKIWR